MTLPLCFVYRLKNGLQYGKLCMSSRASKASRGIFAPNVCHAASILRRSFDSAVAPLRMTALFLLSSMQYLCFISSVNKESFP